MDTKQSASGVEQLINRLKEQGVEEGQRQATDLVDEARSRATQLLEEATRKSEQLKREAQTEAERIKQAVDAALKLAVRDASLKLREEITDRFAVELKQLVSKPMRDPEFVKQMILEVTRRAVPEAEEGGTTILLPASAATIEDLRKNPEELSNPLTKFAAGLGKELLEKGIEFKPANDDRPGIRIGLAKDDIQIDATDEAITELLLKHLMPRFRVLMEGAGA